MVAGFEVGYAVIIKGQSKVFVKDYALSNGKTVRIVNKIEKDEQVTAVCDNSIGACNTARKLSRQFDLEYLGRIKD